MIYVSNWNKSYWISNSEYYIECFWTDFLYLFIYQYFLAVEFFGCSEAKHKQDYGCDEDDQKMDVPDKYKKLVQVHKSHI